MANSPKIRGGRMRPSGLDKMKAARSQVQNEQVPEEQTEEVINTGSSDCIPDVLSIASISPDSENAREFPVVKPSGEEMFISQEKNKNAAYVVLDKGIIENKTPEDHPLYGHIQKQVEEISLLAKQIKSSGGGLYQSIEVYRVGGTDYRIVYGHRRFYAVVFLVGWDGTWNFKVHRNNPKFPKVRQFVENNSQSGLAFYEKLKAFKMAYEEITSADANLSSDQEMEALGIKRSSYYELRKWIQYPILIETCRIGYDIVTRRSISEIFTRNPDLDEGTLKLELATLFRANHRSIPEFLGIKLDAKNETQSHGNNTQRNRIRRNKFFKAPKIKSSYAIKKLLTSDVTQMDIEGIQWDTVDWEDREQVNECLDKTIKALESLKD